MTVPPVPGLPAAAHATLAESLQILHHFTDWHPPDDFRRQCWELTLYAFGSPDSDGWSHTERSNMLFLYQQLATLIDALTVIDQHLYPTFVPDGS